MRRSPLQIDTYFLHELTFEINEKYDEAKPTGDLLNGFQYFTNFDCYDAETHKWHCVLGLRFKPEANINTPYSFNIILIGYFKVEGNIPSNEAEMKLVHANAPALLYTVAREILSSTSARARWGKINLPTVYFPAEKQTEGKEKAEKKKPD
jgi:preprotein translocase subunit SecB